MLSAGYEIHTETIGKGKPILFLHGWGGSTASFRGVAKCMSKTHRVISLDFCGFGKSGEPFEPLTLDDYVEQTVGILELMKESCVVVAHSFGGRVAIRLATRCPQFISGLVLTDSAGIRPRLSRKKRREIARFRRARARGEDLSGFGSSDYRALSPVMQRTFVNIVNEDQTAELKEIAVPTLIVWGNRDTETPVWMAKKMKRRIRGSGLVILNGGHYCYLDEFAVFVRVLDSFCQSLEEKR